MNSTQETTDIPTNTPIEAPKSDSKFTTFKGGTDSVKDGVDAKKLLSGWVSPTVLTVYDSSSCKVTVVKSSKNIDMSTVFFLQITLLIFPE